MQADPRSWGPRFFFRNSSGSADLQVSILVYLPLERGGVRTRERLVPLADGRIHERQCTCPGKAVHAPPALKPPTQGYKAPNPHG